MFKTLRAVETKSLNHSGRSYVGETLQPENNEVTLEMVIEVMAKEFPEFLLSIAEENFIRGYQQALLDTEEGRKSWEETIKKQNG